MTVWFVLEANNVDNDILMSQPFYSEEQAKEHLLEIYTENVRCIGQDEIESSYHNDDAYSILTYDNDYFYGVVRSVNIKEG